MCEKKIIENKTFKCHYFVIFFIHLSVKQCENICFFFLNSKFFLRNSRELLHIVSIIL